MVSVCVYTCFQVLGIFNEMLPIIVARICNFIMFISFEHIELLCGRQELTLNIFCLLIVCK